MKERGDGLEVEGQKARCEGEGGWERTVQSWICCDDTCSTSEPILIACRGGMGEAR